MFKIWDLDNTIVDSKHRQVTLADGTLNLAHWIENNTEKKIMKDTLLPAVIWLRNQYAQRPKHCIIICTARVLGAADYAYFMENDIPFHVMLDRPMGCMLSDAELKDIQLRLYAHNDGFTWSEFCNDAEIYDDSLPVLQRMQKIGIKTHDATLLNHRLKIHL
jgi:hypothetical protein